LHQIGERLRALRGRGHAPQIVVLQEAFTPEARAIGATAGYRYVVDGASASDAVGAPMSPADRIFAEQAAWSKGETEGKFVGSGLQILSDFPVRQVRRMSFPSFACAGFDCLANKGALLATVEIPGATPVQIVTTHLNSRHASAADNNRSFYAYRLQVGALTAFIRRFHDVSLPLIVAGDFNVSAPARRAFLLDAARRGWVANGIVHDALGQISPTVRAMYPDLASSYERARDWQFFGDGTKGRLVLTGMAVPFGRNRFGQMLSDHVGYTATFQLTSKV
jgi:endonuclease/exonuclease/phosphatase family metal-dependent hydrolase